MRFLLSLVQINGNVLRAVFVKFGEIGVDSLHESGVIFAGQRLAVQVLQRQLLGQYFVKDRVLILLDGLMDAAVGKGAGGIRLPRYRSTSLGIP